MKATLHDRLQGHFRTEDDLFQLASDLSASWGGLELLVPAGTVTDFASVPWGLRNMVPRWNRTARPAVFHDRLYQAHNVSRRLADRIFRDLLRAEGIDPIRAWLVWVGVRVGGGPAWRRGRSS